MIKIAGIASEVGYNLGLSALYAVVFSTVFTLGYSRKAVRLLVWKSSAQTWPSCTSARFVGWAAR